MGSANVELVRSIYAATERGDFSAVEWADPRIEFVIADGLSPGTWTGLTGLIEAWRERASAWEGLRVVADELHELDAERVLVLTRGAGGRGKISGLEVEQIRAEGAALYHIRDGRVTKLVLYFERKRALANLGLAPEDLAHS